ncbi:hypothetical protein P3T35_000345 [Kitasatospora sp. GP30]|nr:hypothetical protein [Kitasatospora sp. GP30]
MAGGPAPDVVTTDLISACFDHPVRITREEGRWAARAAARPAASGVR